MNVVYSSDYCRSGVNDGCAERVSGVLHILNLTIQLVSHSIQLSNSSKHQRQTTITHKSISCTAPHLSCIHHLSLSRGHAAQCSKLQTNSHLMPDEYSESCFVCEHIPYGCVICKSTTALTSLTKHFSCMYDLHICNDVQRDSLYYTKCAASVDEDDDDDYDYDDCVYGDADGNLNMNNLRIDCSVRLCQVSNAYLMNDRNENKL